MSEETPLGGASQLGRGMRGVGKVGRRDSSKSGTEAKATPASSREAKGGLITSNAGVATGSREAAGNGGQVNLTVTNGCREPGARLGVPVLAQSPKLLRSATRGS